jgi:alanine-glyoxylate transaminase / (R)-3-amino-2-methylpropionate-pyruvate transaminase
MTTTAPEPSAIGSHVAMPPCDHTPRPYSGPTREEVMAMRRQYINPTIFTLYNDPLMIVEGYMQYLFDETG